MDPNDPDGSIIPDENGNINCDPNFAYEDPNFYNCHLATGSHCIGTGDSSAVGGSEYDIDEDGRIYDGDVDMGADEVTCGDVYNERDWNGDGVVNMLEYGEFAAVWLMEDDDPDWNEKCDFDSDCVIDVNDLEIFCEEWLWEACWRGGSIWYEMMSMGGGFDMGKMMSAQSEALLSSKTAEIAKEEPTTEEQIVQTKDIIEWLEELWKADEDVQETIDEKEWEEFMKKIYDWLDQLEAF